MDFSMSSITAIPSIIAHHYNTKSINWPMVVYLGLVHVVAGVALTHVTSCKLLTLLWTFILWPISGFGITVGAHRLWSHRSYTATPLLRTILMLFNSIANQGSLYHWCRDHRTHHKFSETTADPHNATRGFFFAHVGWLLVKKDSRVISAGRELDCKDLFADPLIKFQKLADPWFSLFMCFVFPALVSMLWGESFLNGYLVPGALRYVAVLHFTWCVNSLAHLYGSRPYDELSNPSENWIVSILAVGEGWHNWHHKYPYDYAASEHGISEQYNPSKLFIDVCVSLGLASDCKRATGAWKIAKKRMAEGKKKTGGCAARMKEEKKFDDVVESESCVPGHEVGGTVGGFKID